MGDAVGLLVPPLLVAGNAVMVVRGLAQDSGREPDAIRRRPFPPGKATQQPSHDDEGQQRPPERWAEDAGNQAEKYPSADHCP